MLIQYAIFTGLFIVLGSTALFLGNVRAGRKLHHSVLRNIIASPMSFFDTTPIGRILNRFGKDIDVIDTLISVNIQAWLTCFLRVIAVPLIIGYSTPMFLTIVLPMAILYMAIQVSWEQHHAIKKECKCFCFVTWCGFANGGEGNVSMIYNKIQYLKQRILCGFVKW